MKARRANELDPDQVLAPRAGQIRLETDWNKARDDGGELSR